MPATRPIEVRFSEKYRIDPITKCWDWIGSQSRGYGYLARTNQTPIAAHKLSFLLFKGEIPDGLQVHHRCHNSLCVNPRHLKLGTHADNMADMKKAGRRLGKNTGSTLSPAQKKKAKAMFSAKKTQQEVADELGVNRTTIQRAIYGGYLDRPAMKRVYLTDAQRRKVVMSLKKDVPILHIAKRFGVDRKTIRNIRDKT